MLFSETLRERLATARIDTLNAEMPYGGSFAETYAGDEWAEMNEGERLRDIEDEYERAISESEEEEESAEAAVRALDEEMAADAAHEVLVTAARDAISAALEETGFTFMRETGWYTPNHSLYLFFQHEEIDCRIKVRISDHEQPAGGGYRQGVDRYGNEIGRAGEAEIDILVDDQESLRAAIQRSEEILNDAR